MRSSDLGDSYPRLYHMAWDGSWPSIREHGLLSTQRLLQLYGLDELRVRRLTREHRPHWVDIEGNGLPTAVVRDQKPMSDDGLRRALQGRAKLNEWYVLLSSMVFFWPTKDRLLRMMGAGAYVGMRHDLLIVDTARLVDAHVGAIRLSPINSGATRPIPHPRDLSLFKTIAEYPFEERKRRRGLGSAVAEVCVVGAVENIEDYVIDVASVTLSEARDLI